MKYPGFEFIKFIAPLTTPALNVSLEAADLTRVDTDGFKHVDDKGIAK